MSLTKAGTVKETGASANDLLIGVEDCNAGLTIRIHKQQKSGRGGRVIGKFDLIKVGNGYYAHHLKQFEGERFDTAKIFIEEFKPLIGLDNTHIINCNTLAVYKKDAK